MKTKLVLWGTDANNEKVLIGLELRPDANKVDIFTFPKAIATEEFTTKLMEEWRNGTEVEFPEGYQHIERELTVADSILPEEIKVDRGELIQRAQTEWHFLVLSTKLNQAYRTELEELKEKVDKLTNYDGGMWDTLKTFWDKVQNQVQERNLFREHADSLRDGINTMFVKLKDMRTSLNTEFEAKSAEAHNNFMALLDAIEERIKTNPKSASIFEDLKQMQADYRTAVMTRDHRNHVWERLDTAFKLAKGERNTGSAGGGDFSSASARIQNRLEGLNAAIHKMETSANRDREELDFQQKKIDTTDGQLEAQIRQAKLRMVTERYESKKAKLDEMIATRVDVEKSLAAALEKEAKRSTKSEKPSETAKVEDTAATKAVSEEPAAESIQEKVEDIVDSTVEATGSLVESLENAMEDTIDTVQAVAEVAAEKIEHFFESITKHEEPEKKEEV
ncbi:MAG: hypothetical protein ACOYOA_08760 [Saprospiraceae bacterium]